MCPGMRGMTHNYWVFPILTEQPNRVIDALGRAGFDATQGQSMCTVRPPVDRPELAPAVARQILEKIVYLPIYPELTLAALRKMAGVVLREAERPAFLGLDETVKKADRDAGSRDAGSVADGEWPSWNENAAASTSSK